MSQHLSSVIHLVGIAFFLSAARDNFPEQTLTIKFYNREKLLNNLRNRFIYLDILERLMNLIRSRVGKSH